MRWNDTHFNQHFADAGRALLEGGRHRPASGLQSLWWGAYRVEVQQHETCRPWSFAVQFAHGIRQHDRLIWLYESFKQVKYNVGFESFHHVFSLPKKNKYIRKPLSQLLSLNDSVQKNTQKPRNGEWRFVTASIPPRLVAFSSEVQRLRPETIHIWRALVKWMSVDPGLTTTHCSHSHRYSYDIDLNWWGCGN